MRFVIFGAGAVGGVVGGRLFEHGHDVLLIARGAHCAAIQEHGLRIESPDRAVTLRIPVAQHPAEIHWTGDNVVFLAMKTQDTAAALRDLAAAAPINTPVVSLQNSVENERIALRLFPHVLGVCVMCPTNFLTPGVVQAWSSPLTGLLDVGCYPSGVDPVVETVASAFRASNFLSEPRPDIMRWKYNKLLMNLGNAIEAIVGSKSGSSALAARARKEGAACLMAAGIPFVSDEEEAARRGDHLRLGTIAAQTRPGGSSWQSLTRRTFNIEADYLNGEIALLGRLHGVPTPVNTLLQSLANRISREGRPPGSMSADEICALLPGIL